MGRAFESDFWDSWGVRSGWDWPIEGFSDLRH